MNTMDPSSMQEMEKMMSQLKAAGISDAQAAALIQRLAGIYEEYTRTKNKEAAVEGFIKGMEAELGMKMNFVQRKMLSWQLGKALDQAPQANP